MEYIEIENKLFNILNNTRITEEKAKEFKQGLIDIKNINVKGLKQEMTLSKQFFLNGLHNNKIRTYRNMRLNRIIKKADIKTKIGFFYSDRLTSKNGILFKEKSKKALTLLSV